MTEHILRGFAILGLVAVLQIGLTHRGDFTPVASSLSTPVHAGGVTVATDEAETVFTSSADGKTIYMWQYYSTKPPKYLGKTEAVLSE